MRNFFFALPCLVMICLSMSCSSAHREDQKSAGQTRSPIAQQKATPTFETQVTLIPSNSPITTLLSTRAPNPTPNLPWTPLPTLDKESSSRKITELLETNDGCQLPCFWGIVPGQTTWQDARQKLETFASEIKLDGSAGNITYNGNDYFMEYYQVKYKVPGTTSNGNLRFLIWDSIVTRISVDREATTRRYTLSELLTQYKKPSRIFVHAQYDAPESPVPFDLILYYPEQRFLAAYLLGAVRDQGYLKSCPDRDSPVLISWAPNRVMDEKTIERDTLGPDPVPALQDLTSATQLSIDRFYEVFRKPQNNACIESPINFWKSLK